MRKNLQNESRENQHPRQMTCDPDATTMTAEKQTIDEFKEPDVAHMVPSHLGNAKRLKTIGLISLCEFRKIKQLGFAHGN